MADESKAAASASGEDDTTLSSTTVDTMLPTALDFAACAGLVSGQSADTPGFTKHVPFALTPSKVHTVVRLRSRVYPHVTVRFPRTELPVCCVAAAALCAGPTNCAAHACCGG